MRAPRVGCEKTLPQRTAAPGPPARAIGGVCRRDRHREPARGVRLVAPRGQPVADIDGGHRQTAGGEEARENGRENGVERPAAAPLR